MKRTIKSFVLRAGRTSNRQQQGLEHYLPAYELPLDGDMWDWQTLFNREAETVVEIGFGMGASLLTMALRHPEINFVGIEVHRAGLGSLAADLHEQGLTNVRLVALDAVEIVKTRIAEASLAGIQLFFPDPWPKKRHHKRRLIQPAFVSLLAGKLKKGGFLHCATDWQDYADHMLEVLDNEPTLINQQAGGGFSPRPETRPLTKFEQRGQRLGHGVWDLIYLKK
ncbi:tRNA (guanosine(46)-N7)-methyltransferase TrmB [Legionella taurinensis]|uniref:tRNA (guanine-N(7)-)-methyltransferase n=1 Tax=Legionella taurinensis TaxID=70611 RepID=A0A3A5LE95_9GAMM|nr:tRNA (guanosine(46)-N7)-methyltransferase TrmB [Legionella taurinensis]MDX1837699.1 tRNA (guanosine(46)-N7)-methyltransferase TrmB [Legionella taurinensis]PUT39983.1 tRNA (guanosine(46)-N7)-methyltransferase TrmB [Legionella taurinensis]PUT43749.1 tRNA (guanosine(46)-N7)-methyltransferase TrmB [Legionella taurinensis]PUT46118.1 tRNA (guanosine(46)-N7)-methyltransferase TrmB [Legionella taurinensis]PUT47904.1 tRNA (guanosine(46)-N7)-methyltransferase TrmB [Legionella taurinensis]